MLADVSEPVAIVLVQVLLPLLVCDAEPLGGGVVLVVCVDVVNELSDHIVSSIGLSYASYVFLRPYGRHAPYLLLHNSVGVDLDRIEKEVSLHTQV